LIEVVETDEDEIRERFGFDGSTGVVGTIVDSAPLVEFDR
jgi:hypothetical protein